MPLVIDIDEKELCRVCGCTDEDCYCCYQHSGDVCHWAEQDLCSTCAAGPPCPGPEESEERHNCYALDVDGETVWIKASADERTVQAIIGLVRFLRGRETHWAEKRGTIDD